MSSLLLASTLAVLGGSIATAEPKPDAEIVFKNRTPAAVAPRLAAECTRRLMALVRNTPEQVVCRYRTRFTRDWPEGTAHELWTFTLTPEGKDKTRVEGHTAIEAASEHGYAVVAFAEQANIERGPMRDFLKSVRKLGDLRGPFGVRPQAAE